MLLLILSSVVAFAQEGSCANPDATAAYKAGYVAQQARKSDAALASYLTCVDLDPKCVSCHYEMGWSYWTRSDWPATVAAWEKTLELDPKHASAQTWIVNARDAAQGKATSAVDASGLRVPLNIKSKGNGPLQLELVARFQNYNARPSKPADVFDNQIYSPKSAHYSADGTKVYVNSLEGYTTRVFDPVALKPIGLIEHHFDESSAPLFQGETTVFGYTYARKSPSGDPNQFKGKPVESTLSNDGRYLWVPYYRRDYDYGATSPGAVSIIDTKTDQIVRVMPTGPIPKYVVASPDGKWMAVTHWGDNTLGLIDISSDDAKTFKYRSERLVVDKVLSQAGLASKNRDAACGSCLRGTAFTPDSKTLLVARMGDGGIAGFDVASGKYLGTLTGEKPTPRHLVISEDGKWLFFSSNRSGTVTKVELSKVVSALRGADGGRVALEEWPNVWVGGGARTIEISPDGKWLFAASNAKSELIAVDAEKLEVVARVRTDRYTVGLAISPDGKQVITTSQGIDRRGGNSVCVYSVTPAP
jgi:DNA-binding beta-propeller fold protein YncE